MNTVSHRVSIYTVRAAMASGMSSRSLKNDVCTVFSTILSQGILQVLSYRKLRCFTGISPACHLHGKLCARSWARHATCILRSNLTTACSDACYERHGRAHMYGAAVQARTLDIQKGTNTEQCVFGKLLMTCCQRRSFQH